MTSPDHSPSRNAQAREGNSPSAHEEPKERTGVSNTQNAIFDRHCKTWSSGLSSHAMLESVREAGSEATQATEQDRASVIAEAIDEVDKVSAAAYVRKTPSRTQASEDVFAKIERTTRALGRIISNIEATRRATPGSRGPFLLPEALAQAAAARETRNLEDEHLNVDKVIESTGRGPEEALECVRWLGRGMPAESMPERLAKIRYGDQTRPGHHSSNSPEQSAEQPGADEPEIEHQSDSSSSSSGEVGTWSDEAYQGTNLTSARVQDGTSNHGSSSSDCLSKKNASYLAKARLKNVRDSAAGNSSEEASPAHHPDQPRHSDAPELSTRQSTNRSSTRSSLHTITEEAETESVIYNGVPDTNTASFEKERPHTTSDFPPRPNRQKATLPLATQDVNRITFKPVSWDSADEVPSNFQSHGNLAIASKAQKQASGGMTVSESLTEPDSSKTTVDCSEPKITTPMAKAADNSLRRRSATIMAKVKSFVKRRDTK